MLNLRPDFFLVEASFLPGGTADVHVLPRQRDFLTRCGKIFPPLSCFLWFISGPPPVVLFSNLEEGCKVLPSSLQRFSPYPPPLSVKFFRGEKDLCDLASFPDLRLLMNPPRRAPFSLLWGRNLFSTTRPFFQSNFFPCRSSLEMSVFVSLSERLGALFLSLSFEMGFFLLVSPPPFKVRRVLPFVRTLSLNRDNPACQDLLKCFARSFFSPRWPPGRSVSRRSFPRVDVFSSMIRLQRESPLPSFPQRRARSP